MIEGIDKVNSEIDAPVALAVKRKRKVLLD
jgi:hypothetical protein